MSRNLVRGFLLGFFVVFGAGMVWNYASKSPAQGDAGQYIMITGNMNNRQYDYLYVIDTTSKRVAVYRYYRNSLDLLDVRNIKYDLRMDFYQKLTGKSIQQVRNALKKRG